MEDVLGVSGRRLDPKRPQVCFDERSKQQVKEVRTPLPSAPGHPARYDTEYERTGVSNLFLFFCPLRNWRHVKVTDRRTSRDGAEGRRELVDVHFPDAERITVVQDNLTPHTPAARYAAFEPAEAKRIWDKREVHSTPQHGRWLTLAEIELRVLSRQCRERRIADQEALRSDVAAWETERNTSGATVNWRFTTADARIKLKHLYPSIEPINS
jgi:hypothetical protein